MPEPKMPPLAEEEWYAEERRHIEAISAWLNRWPNFRQHAAMGALGAAIGFADIMGCDVEGFLKTLRAAGLTQKASGVIVPPKGS